VRYHALACDYDGTLATDGIVREDALAALTRLRESGRRVVLVTGRELADLRRVFDRFDLFDRVVAENGAVIYRPDRREEKVIAEPPSPEFVRALRAEGVSPLSVGRVVVATHEPHEKTVLDVIHRLGLELHVIFNKGAVMILPSGMNKAKGLATALAELCLSFHEVAGIGDAENDHAFLAECECAVAVANALPALKERADLVTDAADGRGVAELVDRIVEDDLADLAPRLGRHHLEVGVRPSGEAVRIPPYGVNVLVAGTPGGGKSTFATSVLERLVEARRQFCIIDPEGDYPSFEGAVVLGDKERVPGVDEVLDLMAKPDQNGVVDLLGIELEGRPAFFEALFPRLVEMRSRAGRPHWIVVDETHHLLPAAAEVGQVLPREVQGMMFVTVHPDSVAAPLLSLVDLIVVAGTEPGKTLETFSRALGIPAPRVPAEQLDVGALIGWWHRRGTAPFLFRSIPPQAERRRHIRKYATGELRPDRSFYFQGPEHKLNLRAHNLTMFMQLGEGVDDETWLHHLRRGDYSAWMRRSIKDEALAAAVAAVEAGPDQSPRTTRRRIRELIEDRYTAPA
jgi:hydroxymethylpyrimidine pyrophosphatase-like HAD family hydrolase